MFKNLTIAVTATHIRRRENSTYGNPRYDIVTDHGKFHTAPDTDFSYSLPNYFGHGTRRVPLTITLNGWGKVSEIVFHDMRAA